MMKEEVIEEGIFINYSDKKEDPYCFKLLNESAVDLMMALQNKTYANLQDKNIYVPGLKETLLKDLTNQGITGGIFTGNKLIAFSSVHFMAYDTSFVDVIPGEDIPPSDLKGVVRYRYTSVDPEFIRNGLSNKIAFWLHDYIIKKFQHIQYFVSMVSPRNYPSLRQQLDLKLYGKTLKKNAAGLDRIIMFKDVKEAFEKDSINSIIVPSKEDERIKQAFGEGYRLIEAAFNQELYLTFAI